MKKILPSILSADFLNLERDIKDIESAGADLLHLDIMDGHFVPNLTIGPQIVKQIDLITPLELDVHLMLQKPQDYVEAFAISGADYITFHIEADCDPHNVISQIKKIGKKAGLSLRPKTKIQDLKKYIKLVDLILVMSVNPGFGGQAFMPESIQRVEELVKLCQKAKTSPIIEIDGGVGLDNIKALSAAGVQYFVAGTTIFKAKSRKETIAKMRSLALG